MFRKEVRGRGVTSDFHRTELIELPGVQIGGSVGGSTIKIIAVRFHGPT